MKQTDLMKLVRATEKENDFRDRKVIPLVAMLGWMYYFTADSRRSPEGYPDLHLVRNVRSVFVELKMGNRKLTWDQERWFAALKGAGHECYVIRGALGPEHGRPDDLDLLREILIGRLAGD